MDIRRARRTDIDLILAMQRRIHAQHLAWDAARWTTMTPIEPAYRAWLERLILDTHDGLAMVASTDDAVAGYLIAEVERESTHHWSPEAVYLHDLFVDPAYRRTGIARALVEQLLQWSGEAHPTLQLRLVTANENEAARSFFARLGFRACVVEMIRDAP